MTATANRPPAANGHPPPAAPGSYQTVPLARVKPWPGNPRKTFNGIEDLAANMKEMGVLVPLLVRPARRKPTAEEELVNLGLLTESAGAPPECYEVADGERRYRAATLAGVKELPVIVRALTDVEMLEIAVVSCEQREDVPALEKAQGYRRLLSEGRTVEQIAAKLGKGVSAVRDLVALCDLPPLAARQLQAGRLPHTVATLIARVPGAEYRERLARLVVAGEPWRSEVGDQEVERAVKDGKEPLTFRQTKEVVRQRFTVELKGCCFEQDDAALPGGPCTVCPRRAGNVPELVAEKVRADVCTDPGCFREKVKAWRERTELEAAARGQKLLPEEEARKLFPYGTVLSHTAPYFDLADQCSEDNDRKNPRSYKQLLKGHVRDEDVVLCTDKSGQLHRLVHKDVALPVLRREHGLHKESGHNTATEKTTEEQKRDRAKRLLEAKLERETAREVLARAAAAAEKMFEAAPQGALPNAVLRVLCRDALRGAYPSVIEDVCDRRGLTPREGRQRGLWHLKEALERWTAGATGPQLLGLMAELSAGRHVGAVGNPDHDHKDLTFGLGLHRKGIEQEVRKRLREAKAAKKAGGKGDAAPPAAGKPGLTLATPLLELVPWPAEAAAEPLRRAGMATVGDVLKVAAASDDPRLRGSAPQQRVYEVLKAVPQLTRDHALAIGDAICHAGGPGKIPPGAPVQSPTPPAAGFDAHGRGPCKRCRRDLLINPDGHCKRCADLLAVGTPPAKPEAPLPQEKIPEGGASARTGKGARPDPAPAPPTPGPAANGKPRFYESYEVKRLRRMAADGNAEAKRELEARGVPVVGKRGRPKKEVPSS